ncbi:hypothetical protein J5226_02175 [Lysobacter sp. K5869]|uniref:hypothetical protein n=1 Tax=Lysobacter sp. K5869 TaxID=2820808 RepID=UPI001C063751|nr:hypothetical protein [Lysobacter sp. K5869]QWP77234.1 hypothetical protein J5226_02175 [Lysobacter sp. K5869]
MTRAAGRGKTAVTAAVAWLAGLAWLAWTQAGPGAWVLPLAATLLCAIGLLAQRWPRVGAARALAAAAWTALFCFALTPPLYGAIASAARAWNPNRFLCDADGRMVRCGMIGIEVVLVPLALFAFALVYRWRWSDAAVERYSVAVAAVVASAWLGYAAL